MTYYLTHKAINKLYSQHAPLNAPRYTNARWLLKRMVDEGCGEMSLGGAYCITREDVLAYVDALATPKTPERKKHKPKEFQHASMISPEYKKYLRRQ